MRIAAVVAILILLPACSSLDLSNRLARTADGQRLYVVSLWGRWLGVASEIAKADADALFRKARARAGLSGFTFHDSRATALTRLSRQVDVMTLARISGHRDLALLLRVYYRETPAQIAARL